MMAMITEIFIFKLFTYTSSFSALPQTGSIPKGYTQPGMGRRCIYVASSPVYLGWKGGSKQDEKKFILNPAKSL